MTTWYPDRKVLAGGLAGVITWGITVLAARYGVVLPPELETLIVGGVGWLIAYLVPPSRMDIVKRLDEGLVAMAAENPKVPVRPEIADVINGAKRIVPMLLVCVVLGAGLTACASTDTTRTAIEEAVKAGKELTPEQKWELACQGMDAAHMLYIGFIAPKQSEETNLQELAAYEGVKAICNTRPTNMAAGLVALVSAVNAYNRAFPTKVTKA